MPLQQGSIVWCKVYDRQGRNPKCRAGVIITETNEIEDNGQVVIVAIAGDPDDPSVGLSVELPWHRDKRLSRTGLTKKCYAICHWLVAIRVSDIEDVTGRVPADRLNVILENLPS